MRSGGVTAGGAPLDTNMEKPMQVDLEGKRALVTGGTTGIGCGIAFGLARCGAALVIKYSKSFESAREVVGETTPVTEDLSG
jgi:NAD(P)-dependent dehydrogenase (short-subunit alcohol dehydrogenase family)